mmetsp:Transcript_124365/g.398252  ORF Transcript_124365/g.398252 Transcript_124365/m.398252 type:complete len:248 (+) Transcript_124365:1045-1788(+)
MAPSAAGTAASGPAAGAASLPSPTPFQLYSDSTGSGGGATGRGARSCDSSATTFKQALFFIMNCTFALRGPKATTMALVQQCMLLLRTRTRSPMDRWEYQGSCSSGQESSDRKGPTRSSSELPSLVSPLFPQSRGTGTSSGNESVVWTYSFGTRPGTTSSKNRTCFSPDPLCGYTASPPSFSLASRKDSALVHLLKGSVWVLKTGPEGLLKGSVLDWPRPATFEAVGLESYLLHCIRVGGSTLEVGS